MKSKNFVVLIIVSSFIFCNFVFAETPVVRSFLFSRASVMSRQPISFSWSVDSGGAPDLWFLCPSGVRLTKTDGTAFSCNTRQTLSDLSSDAIDLIVTNTSGSYQMLKVTLTPRDASGILFPDLAKTISVSVSPDQDPIDDFTSSASTTERVASFQPIVVSWVANGTSGVNLKRLCGDSNIKATSSEATLLNIPDLPCNENLFSTDKPNTGFFTIYLSNMTNNYSDFKLMILPAMESGIYDGTHAETLVFSVEPYKPPVFSVNNFGFLDSKIYYRASTTLSWGSSGSNGINFKSSCQGDLSIYFSYGATTTLSHCNEYLFDGFLDNVGSSTIYFQGSSSSFQPVRFFMIPRRSDGLYDSILAKSLDVTVQSSTVQPSFWIPTNPVVNVQTNTQTNLSYVPKNQFTKYLSRGSTGTEVVSLQTFLRQYRDLYPEGLVTGMYGPATERAVKRFQEKYKIAYVGSLGYGNVGVKTRAKLNEF
jgi:hypothetical protein